MSYAKNIYIVNNLIMLISDPKYVFFLYGII